MAPNTSVATFTNSFGEDWELTVDPAAKVGTLQGDETEWDSLPIADGRLQSSFMLADDEAAWLADAWKNATGEDLDLALSSWSGLASTFRSILEPLLAAR